MKIAGSDERWENWLQFTQSRLVPKFTEVRFIEMPLALRGLSESYHFGY